MDLPTDTYLRVSAYTSVKHEFYGVGSRGPLKGPWWGPGGEAPGSSEILDIFKGLNALWENLISMKVKILLRGL